MASSLVRLTPDRTVWVPALAMYIALRSWGKTLYSHSSSLHPGVQTGTGEFNAGGNPGMASHAVGSGNIPSHFMLQKLG